MWMMAAALTLVETYPTKRVHDPAPSRFPVGNLEMCFPRSSQHSALAALHIGPTPQELPPRTPRHSWYSVVDVAYALCRQGHVQFVKKQRFKNRDVYVERRPVAIQSLECLSKVLVHFGKGFRVRGFKLLRACPAKSISNGLHVRQLQAPTSESTTLMQDGATHASTRR